jgi:ankyrin repeat protein
MASYVRFNIFIGGPKDTKDFRTAIRDRIKGEVYRRYREQANLIVNYFDNNDNPVSVEVHENWQERIEKHIDFNKQNVAIMLFCHRLGTPTNYEGTPYESWSDRELREFLKRPDCKVAICRHDKKPDLVLPPDYAELNDERKREIFERINEQGTEYKRLETYFKTLRGEDPRLSMHQYSSEEQLCNIAADFVSRMLEKHLENVTRQQTQLQEKPEGLKRPGWPFRSYANLTEQDYDVFFGREDEVNDILKRLDDSNVRLLCIVGQSGAGKSSLLQAGILPPLLRPELAEKHGIKHRPGTLRLLFTPGSDPFERLCFAAYGNQQTGLSGSDAWFDPFKRACEGDSAQIAEAVKRYLADGILAGRDPEAELLIVIDQAEKLWTECTKPKREAFLKFIVAALNTPRIRVLMTLRSDLRNNIDEFEPIRDYLNQSGRGYVPPLFPPTKNQLARMIEQSIDAAELKHERGLIARIENDAAAMGGSALFLMAHVLCTLVEQSRDGRLTHASYKAMNGLAGAVQTSLERAGPIENEQLHPLFNLLYDLQNGVPVRRLVTRIELDEVGKKLGTDLWPLTNRMIEARILHGDGDRDKQSQKPSTIQFAHDGFFKGWDTLHKWIDAHRRDLELRDELQRSAANWKSRGRRSSHLRLRPEALDEVLDIDREKPYLFQRYPIIRQYLDAAKSLRLREALIGHLKGGHLSAALKAYEKGARLTTEDRGDEPNQLVPAFYAAVTGDDRIDEEFFAPSTSETPKISGKSLFDTKDNVSFPLTRGLTPLHIAALFGHLPLIEKLVEKGANLLEVDHKGFNVLHLAAFGGHKNVARYLVEEKGFDFDTTDTAGGTPLCWALNRGNEDVASYLLELGASLSFSVKGGFNALTEATRGGLLNWVEMLVDGHHFDANGRMGPDFTVLYAACSKGDEKYLKIARFLLKRGALPNGSDRGYRPLAAAAENGAVAMLNLLIECGADLNMANTPDGETPLHCAARLASSTTLRALLDRPGEKANPNCLSEFGDTPLSCAASKGRDEIVELLLQAGADPNLRGGGAWNALQYAAEDGDLVLTRILLDPKLDCRTDVNAMTTDQWTPLHLASRRGNESIVALLLEKDADVSARIKDGATPLHLAALNGHEVVVRLLLEKEPELVNARADAGVTALHLAAGSGQESIVRLLLERKPDLVDARISGEWTALHLAANKGHESVVRLLLDRNAVVNARTQDEATALHLAAGNGHEPVVRLLLDREPDLADALDKDEWTALHFAAKGGHEPVVRLLLDKKPELVDALDKNEWAALHLAALNGYEPVVRLLLDRNADVNARTKDEATALHLAAGSGHELVVRLLLDRKPELVDARADGGVTALHAAAGNGHESMVHLLLEREPELVDARDNDQWTALHFAAQSGHEPVVRLLLDREPELEDARANGGVTGLHIAARNGHAAVVRFFLERAPELVDARADGGVTALHAAARNGHEAVARLLLERAPELADVHDNNQWAALHFAAQGGHEPVVRLLLERKPELVDARDNKQWTALHVATLNGHEAVAHLLLDRAPELADEQADGGVTALHLAARNGHESVVRLLLDRKPDLVDARDNDQWMALHFAAEGGHEAVARLLLDKVPELVDARADGGMTALHLAAGSGHVPAVRLLLDRKPELVDARDNKQWTALHVAALNGHEAVAHLLLDREPGLMDVPADGGVTALHLAARNGHEAVTHLLLDRKPELVDARDNKQWTALHAAVLSSHEAVVRLLLDLKPELLDVRADGGVTALHLASRNGHEAVMRLLLDREPELVDAPDSDQWTALHFAAQGGHEAVARLLLDREPELVDARADGGATALHLAAGSGHEPVALLLLDRKPELVDARADGGVTALHVAAGNGHEAVVRLLLDRAPELVDARDNDQWTALHFAAQGGHEPVVRLLLDRVPELVDVRADRGMTALHLATRNGHESVARLLLDRKPELVDARDNKQWTALHFAAGNGHEAVARLLLERAPELVDARADGGVTALHAAARNGHEATVHLLLDRKPELVDARADGEVTALHVAAGNGHEAVARLLLERAPELVDARDNDQWTALHFAAQGDHEAVARLLLERKPELVDALDDKQRTALDIAAQNGHKALVLVLIEQVRELTKRGAREPSLWRRKRVSEEAWFIEFTEVENATRERLIPLLEKLAPFLLGTQESWKLRSAPLAFLPKHDLIAIEHTDIPGQNEQFAVQCPDGSLVPLNWSNEPIYSLIERGEPKFDDDNLMLYCRFFFHWVRGQLGRFAMIDRVEQIRWMEEVPEAMLEEVSQLLMPLKILERFEDRVRMNATVGFKNAIFQTDVLVALRETDIRNSNEDPSEHFTKGQFALVNESPVREDLPIEIDPSSGIFG